MTYEPVAGNQTFSTTNIATQPNVLNVGVITTSSLETPVTQDSVAGLSFFDASPATQAYPAPGIAFHYSWQEVIIALRHYGLLQVDILSPP
jgi:hypothetical protein